MIEGIVFDMDGVLIDSHPVHKRAWKKFLDTLGMRVSDEDLSFILEGRRREEILRYFLGDLPDSQIAKYGNQKDQFFEKHVDEVRLIPGVERFLNELKSLGLKTAVATSASASRTLGTLRRLGMIEAFAAIVTGDDVVVGKPDPEVYSLASRRVGLAPEKLLVFEDAPCGVEAARLARMRCVGVTSNGRAELLRRSGAEFVIRDFAEFSISDVLDVSFR
jgi:HAD superfamily hydrolase (TIGR01509 family)